MRSAVEQLILAMIRDGFECRSVGDARNGTLYLDLTFERNAVCRLEDARAIFFAHGIEFSAKDAEALAELFTPVRMAPSGPSYVYLIASFDDAGFVHWRIFANRSDLDRAWSECEDHGRRFEACED